MSRSWVAVVAVAAIAVGGLAVVRLRGVFGSEPIFTATNAAARPLTRTTLKTVVYEVHGPPDTRGGVSFLDDHAVVDTATFTGLPWTHTLTTTAPSMIASVAAQGDGATLGCRITIDGRPAAEHLSTGHAAQTSCLVKAA